MFGLTSQRGGKSGPLVVELNRVNQLPDIKAEKSIFALKTLFVSVFKFFKIYHNEDSGFGYYLLYDGKELSNKIFSTIEPVRTYRIRSAPPMMLRFRTFATKPVCAASRKWYPIILMQPVLQCHAVPVNG
jgi:hypothetical protein